MVTKNEMVSGRKKKPSIIPDIAYLIQGIPGFGRNANIFAGNSLDPVWLKEFTFLNLYTHFAVQYSTFWVEHLEQCSGYTVGPLEKCVE